MPYTIPLRTTAAASAPAPSQGSSDAVEASGSGSGSGSIYQLFEIPQELLPHFTTDVKGRHSTDLTIKGLESDSAVLTTSNATYTLRSVSQSNSLLLCSLQPSSSGSDKAKEGVELRLQSTVMDTLECQVCVPHLQRITSLLRPSRYRGRSTVSAKGIANGSGGGGGDDDESARSARRYTRQELYDLVQASDAEITQALDEQRVLELDGVMRQLDDEFATELLAAILAQVEVNAYLLDGVPLHELAASLDKEFDYDPEVVRQTCTRLFGKKREGEGADGEDLVELDQMAIARFLGVQELKKARVPIPVSTFFTSWQAASGSTLSPHVSLTLLRGEYLLHPAPQPYNASSPSATIVPSFTIQRFSTADLPDAPAMRFQDLFNTRPTWTADDLEPFIVDLAGDKKKRDALLLKFCRASKVKIVDWSEELKVYFGEEGTEEVKQESAAPVRGRGRREVKTREVTMYSSRVKF